MYVMGIRVVRMDGKDMSLWGGLLRWVCIFLAILPAGLGVLWVLIDDRRQGWQDKLVHTCVIYAWHAEEESFIISRFKRWLWGDRSSGFWRPQRRSGCASAGLPTSSTC